MFVELEVWFLNCIFGFVGATLHLQLLLPIILNWKGISLSLSFFSWVVNLTYRSRVRFKSKAKKEYCFPSRLSCKCWGFFLLYSPTINNILIFSFLRVFGTSFQLHFRSTVLVWGVREPMAGKQGCVHPYQALMMLFKAEPKSWGAFLSVRLRTLLRLWGMSSFVKCFCIDWTRLKLFRVEPFDAWLQASPYQFHHPNRMTGHFLTFWARKLIDLIDGELFLFWD